MEQKVERCFVHVNENWEDSWYETSIDEWENVKKFIVDHSDHQCPRCGTHWASTNYICITASICCACDDHAQPFLSNPINREHVMKYIDEQHWVHILPELVGGKAVKVAQPED